MYGSISVWQNRSGVGNLFKHYIFFLWLCCGKYPAQLMLAKYSQNECTGLLKGLETYDKKFFLPAANLITAKPNQLSFYGKLVDCLIIKKKEELNQYSRYQPVCGIHVSMSNMMRQFSPDHNNMKTVCKTCSEISFYWCVLSLTH